MSTYIPTVWKNNATPSINAENLNHLEAGVLAAHVGIAQLVTGVTPAGYATRAKIAESVAPASRLVVGGVRMWVSLADPSSPVGYLEV